MASAASKLRTAASGSLIGEIDQAQAGERPEVARLQGQRTLDVLHRGAVVADDVVERGTLVPGFGEVGLAADQLVQRLQRCRMIAAAHGLGGAGEQPSTLRVRGLAPDGPDLGFHRCRLEGAGSGLQPGEERLQARVVLACRKRPRDDEQDQGE